MQVLTPINTLHWEQNLQRVMGDLGARERRFGEYLLRYREMIVAKPIAQLASEAQVSEATVVRTCHKMGYAGLKELKQVIGRERTRTHTLSSALPENQMLESLKLLIFEGAIQSLRDTMCLVDNNMILQACKALCRANHISVYAFGGSVPVARSFKHQFMKLGISINVNSELQPSIIAAEKYAPHDVAVAITNSGNTAGVVSALESARNKGATTICITGNPKSEVIGCSDICLLAMGDPLPEDGDNSLARIAQTSIVNLLYAGVGKLYQKYNS